MKPHKNNNEANGNFAVYEIVVNGKTYKIGKADLDRITLSSGNPTRIHQQIRKLRQKYGRQNVYHTVLETLLGVTTQQAKDVEKAILQLIYEREGYIPEGNQNSFKPL